MLERHSVSREGVIAGILGATSVAVWFLILDMIAGQPLYTPTVLGRALFSVLGPFGTEGTPTYVLGYTVFHYAAFIALGLLVAFIIARARKDPSILAGSLILFVAAEVGFHGFVALLAQPEILGRIAWYQIALGNLIAAVVMGTYLWRAHPELRGELDSALGGAEPRHEVRTGARTTD